MNPQRRARGLFIPGAILSVALLMNVLVIAPAFHQHGALHDARNCAICTVHASGGIAPPIATELPGPALTSQHLPLALAAHPLREHTLAWFPRGPPETAADLI